MATTANLTPGVHPVDNGRQTPDPFLTPAPADGQRQRFAGLDAQYSSLYVNGSPAQAKRALEAHLAETERRLQEASRLGTILVKQRQELSERLKDVDTQKEEDEVHPELRQKLVQLEREVNEVTRESARAFLSRSRVASSESSDPSVLSSEAHASPSKVQPPSSRKQRNQAPSRVNDIKLATDISHSLLNQVRELQAAFAEKDEALKVAVVDKSQLEGDLTALRQRLRSLDENEQRFKDENWSLETQVHELTASRKELAEREVKLQQQLNLSRTQGADILREFEEMKQAHGKLSDDHGLAQKHHDSEIAALKREVSSTETERNDLQRRMEELVDQNKELAKAISYRMSSGEYQAIPDLSLDSVDPEDGRATPEQSPPGSPSKATPRHGALESETLKSSLHHAHRMIQNLKNNIHREKTEKIELKRLLQEARDDLETRRGPGAVDSGKRQRKQPAQDVFKKPARPTALGAARSGREEIIEDDPDWEEHDGSESPSRKAAANHLQVGAIPGQRPGSSNMNYPTDNYITATENSDAFETANERDDMTTETEAFQTGNEDLGGDSDGDATETEASGARRPISNSRPSPMNRYSFQSTASTSDDEDFVTGELKTPVQQQSRFKVNIGRGGRRASLRTSTESPAMREVEMQDSPASVVSSTGTPQAGQSLFAELENLSDAETEEGASPYATTILSPEGSPSLPRKSPAPSQLRNVQTQEEKPRMVSSGMMTEPWEPESKSILTAAPAALGAAIAGGLGFVVGKSSDSKADEASSAETNPIKSTNAKAAAGAKKPVSVSPSAEIKQELSHSPKLHQHIEPVEAVSAVIAMPKWSPSPVLSQSIEPVEPVKPVAVAFERSPIGHVEIDAIEPLPPAVVPMPVPVEEPKKPQTPLSRSLISHQAIEPIEPTVIPTVVPVAPARTEPAGVDLLSKVKRAAPAAIIPIVASQSDPDQTRGRGLDESGPHNAQRQVDVGPLIAEDATAQQLNDNASQNAAALGGGLQPPGDARTPFQPIEANRLPLSEFDQSKGRALSPTKTTTTSTGGTQTSLSAEDLDDMMNGDSAGTSGDISKAALAPAPLFVNGPGPRRSRESSLESKSRRPQSAGSVRGRNRTPPPPLPNEAKLSIAAASQRGSGAISPGKMGPPTMPASAYKGRDGFRPQTPVNQSKAMSPTKGQSTVRPSGSQAAHRSVAASPTVTRRSSVTSFASELDHRFNIHQARGEGNIFGAGTNIDPRMIQAITQTMMGEYLWKYTRKAGRGEMSSTRHRRFFWVHPYTKTLYWSEKNPAHAGSAQLKAKSVAIQSVHMINDENPMPPGLHRKSIVVTTPGRTIQFTASTSQRHETWFNALSYLLLPTRADPDDEETLAADDVDEFNPTMRSNSRMTTRSRASARSHASAQPANRSHRPSMDGQRTESTLIPRQGSMSGRFSSLGGVFRSSSAARGGPSAQGSRTDTPDTAYEHRDSAEMTRQVIEAQERDADRLENVRACCDGKHDVGHITHKMRAPSRSNRRSVTGRSHTRTGSYTSTTASTSRRHQEMDPANYEE